MPISCNHLRSNFAPKARDMASQKRDNGSFSRIILTGLQKKPFLNLYFAKVSVSQMRR